MKTTRKRIKTQSLKDSNLQKLQRENRKLKKEIKDLEKEIIDLDRVASIYQFDETASDYRDQIDAFFKRQLNDKKKEGGQQGNNKKATAAAERQESIKQFLLQNPHPDTHAYSLPNFLIKILKLDVSERTVFNDLKKINLEKR